MDFKVVTSVSADKFGAWEESKFAHLKLSWLISKAISISDRRGLNSTQSCPCNGFYKGITGTVVFRLSSVKYMAIVTSFRQRLNVPFGR
jgi:hypothetical protein